MHSLTQFIGDLHAVLCHLYLFAVSSIGIYRWLQKLVLPRFRQGTEASEIVSQHCLDRAASHGSVFSGSETKSSEE